mgnify:CR=1 FL=1
MGSHWAKNPINRRYRFAPGPGSLQLFEVVEGSFANLVQNSSVLGNQIRRLLNQPGLQRQSSASIFGKI